MRRRDDKLYFASKLKLALQDDFHGRVYLGEMPEEKFSELNRLRVKLGVQIICRRDIFIYSGVIKKLRSHRLILDRMSVEQVISIATSAMFDVKSMIVQTRFSHIQAFVLPRDDGVTVNVVYVGEYQGGVSLKSIYINDLKDINKQALEGGRQPSSNPSDLAPPIFTSFKALVVKVSVL